jgi:hypothetical protein
MRSMDSRSPTQPSDASGQRAGGRRLALTSILLVPAPIVLYMLAVLVDPGFMPNFYGTWTVIFISGGIASLSAIGFGVFAMSRLPWSSEWNGAAVAGVILGAIEVLAIAFLAWIVFTPCPAGCIL